MAKQAKTTNNTAKVKKTTAKQSKLKLQKEKDYSQTIIIAILSALLILVSVNIVISAISANNFITTQDNQIDSLRREVNRLKEENGEGESVDTVDGESDNEEGAVETESIQ